MLTNAAGTGSAKSTSRGARTALAVALVLPACEGASGGASAGAASSGAASAVASSSGAQASPSASGIVGAAAVSAARSASPASSATSAAKGKVDPKVVAKAVADGRAKVKDKDLEGGLAAFEAGLALAPKDPTLLGEAAWTAFRLDKLDKASGYAKQGLAVAGSGPVRARILYTAGRIAEKKGDKEVARTSYAAALALREDAETRKRLDAVGGAPEAKLECGDGAASLEALCTCLLGQVGELTIPEGAKTSCGPVKGSSLGSPNLQVLGYGSSEDDLGGERAHVLVAHDGATYRVVAELGHDFTPGAFGVENRWRLVGGTTRTLGEREVVVVRSTIENHDTNLAGLELCEHRVEQETVCAMGDATRPTRCVVVPVKTVTGCGAGVEPDDEESKALVAERKKDWSKETVVLAWTLEPDGRLVVKRVSGDVKLVDAEALGPHPLFLATKPEDAAKGEPTKGEPAKGEPAKGEPAKGEPAKGEPAKGEPAK